MLYNANSYYHKLVSIFTGTQFDIRYKIMLLCQLKPKHKISLRNKISHMTDDLASAI